MRYEFKASILYILQLISYSDIFKFSELSAPHGHLGLISQLAFSIPANLVLETLADVLLESH